MQEKAIGFGTQTWLCGLKHRGRRNPGFLTLVLVTNRSQVTTRQSNITQQALSHVTLSSGNSIHLDAS